ncbi:LOW QUALITY PROTEIN: butyrophilin subfamily 1 member A1-like [Falco biarmicus]|uniref:LOW QUALITY PROTEIN: butyrophilin subfamily 1 member A1-like n=1 Tax=Falco biarmicus TaxID=345155 RepID=UPI0024BD311A|nr:LOW QUALITY PROTEIN: butyrophilin subfamily 1 member A1-like [Falco biarmicus]
MAPVRSTLPIICSVLEKIAVSLLRFTLDVLLLDVLQNYKATRCGVQPATTLPIIIFLQLVGLVTGQFRITPPNNPVIGVIGNEVTLPCQVEVTAMPEQFSIQWTFTGNSKNINVVVYDRRKTDTSVLEDQAYQGRTNFFPSGLNKGNVSLHLKNIMISDKGKYTCSVFFEQWYDAVVVYLEVAAKGDESLVSLDGHTGQGVGVTCKSRGWFPEPKVVWLNSKGQPRHEAVTTQNVKTSSGFFDVVSSMCVEPGSDKEVTCSVINNLLNAGCESRVLISDVFFPSTSPWMTAFLVILFLDIAVFAATGYKLTRSFKETRKAVTSKKAILAEKQELEKKIEIQKKTQEAGKYSSAIKIMSINSYQKTSIQDLHRDKNNSFRSHPFIVISSSFHCTNSCCSFTEMSNDSNQIDQLKLECGFWEARSHAVPVRPDPDGRVLELRVPAAPGAESEASDPAGTCAGSTVPVLVGKEGFAAGKHYWEVAVGDGQDWVLGVLGTRGGQGEEGAPCGEGEGCWALHSSRGQVYSSGGGSGSERLQRGAAVVGVLLDLEGGQVNFYDVEQTAVMVPAPLRLGKGRAGRFYPFLSRREGTDTPRILPVSTPPPLKLL